MEFFISEKDKTQRIDLFLSKSLELSRSQIKRLIENGNIRVNDSSIKPSYQLKIDDKVTVEIPPSRPADILPEPIPLEIIYEDRDIIVINKPSGLSVHPGAGRRSNTLVNALLYHCKDLSGVGGVERPGIVHRLDKDTSGVLVVAKNDKAHQSLSNQFKFRKVKKTYLALVDGHLEEPQGTIFQNIGRHPVNRKKMTVFTEFSSLRSRSALTEYRVIKQYKKFALLEVKIKTGRTHQIRVHLSHLGHPVLGDPLYGKGTGKGAGTGKRLFLHAYKIKFFHPRTGKLMGFKAEMPKDMLYYLKDADND